MLRLVLILLALVPAALAQAADPLELYRALRTNGLDRTRVYRVRDAEVDVEDIHLILNDGVIALLEPVAGHTTGAFFAGDGEVLVVPPTQVERESLVLHTGQAVLEERFSTAYFRISDAFTDRILAATRGPADDPQAYVEKWDPAARSLSGVDALHLLSVLTRASTPGGPSRHVFHARLAGGRLGTFDVYLDTAYQEQVYLGQTNEAEGRVYYDIWAAFPMRSARNAPAAAHAREQPATELGRREIAIGHYHIDARIEPPHQLEADATLDAEVLEGGDRVLLFQLSRHLRVSSVQSSGTAVAFLQNEALEGGELARRGNDLVAVVFPQPLQAGQRLHLRFHYAGPVLTEAGGGLMYVGARGNWYPSQETAMADYDFRFRYPSPWTLLATGKRIGETESGQEKQSHWISERPIPMAGFEIGEYVSSSARAGNTLVESFASKGMESAFHTRPQVVGGGDKGAPPMVAETRPQPGAHAPLVAEDAARALDFLSARIAPFPYSTLALTQIPGASSMGWPGLIFLSGLVYLSPDERAGLAMDPVYEITYARLMLQHEVAHEWFGDAVMRRGYRDDWLMEGIANYYAMLMLEKEHPADFRSLLTHYRERLLSKVSTGLQIKDAGPVTLGTRLFTSRVPGAYESVLYGRGTWLLHMLRHMLRQPGCAPETAACEQSDQLFLQTLRQLYTTHLGRSLSTADLQKAVEDVLPRSAWYEGRKSLDWFFQGWVNGTAIPHLELTSVHINQRSAKPLATASLLQREAPNSLLALVPIYARVQGRPQHGESEPEKLVYLRDVFADGAETSLRLPVPPGTVGLVLDPYYTVLRRP